MYGSVSWYTEWCYWHRDSILKQTLMLLDKTGLRKGKPEGKKSLHNDWKRLSPEERAKENREKGIQMALRFGIGYEQYKKEVDAIRAQRIRERLEKYGEAVVIDKE